MIRLKNFLWCLSLEFGGYLMGYGGFAFGTFLGLFFLMRGTITIIDESIASGIVYIMLGLVVLILYASVSKTLLKGIRNRDPQKVQWFSIFLLVTLSTNVFLLIITVSSKNENKIIPLVIFSILAILNAYGFIVISSLQAKYLEENGASSYTASV